MLKALVPLIHGIDLTFTAFNIHWNIKDCIDLNIPRKLFEERNYSFSTTRGRYDGDIYSSWLRFWDTRCSLDLKLTLLLLGFITYIPPFPPESNLACVPAIPASCLQWVKEVGTINCHVKYIKLLAQLALLLILDTNDIVKLVSNHRKLSTMLEVLNKLLSVRIALITG